MRASALLLALPLLWWNCDSSDDESAAPGLLRGRVLDAAGQPLVGVPVLLNYELPYSTTEGDTLLANAAEGTIPLWFGVSAETRVVLTVHDLESHAVLDTLLDRMVEAGYDSLHWDLRDREGRLLSADCYRVMMHTDQDDFGFVMLVNPDYANLAQPWMEATHTNSSGSFALRENQLAFRHGQNFNLINRAGWDIGNWSLDPETRVRVLARLDDGTLLSSDWLDLDLEAGVDVVLHAP